MPREPGNTDVFLRAINLCYDAEYPERIAHYQPTAKSARCLRALAGFDDERAFFIVAPYGSGKSILATYLLHLIENRRDASHILLELAHKLSRVSPELGHFAMKRRRQHRRAGLVLALHGYAKSLPHCLKAAALAAMARLKLGRQARPLREMPCEDIEQAMALLGALQAKVSQAMPGNYDRIVILWDEFGRHLESLVAEGRTAALSDIQMLAEFVSRTGDPPMTLGLLLHQDLLRYAGTMPQSVRAEWTKIEGRFQTIQYIDDSKEIYWLIGSVMASRAATSPPNGAAVRAAAVACSRLDLFTDFNENELENILNHAYPLGPVTLYLLPRLSARVAQNERTLFSFLSTLDQTTPVGSEQLYDYFAPIMRADTAVGGTYRQWLETQSALAKVDQDDTAAKVLKNACLLGLGTSGERSRVSRDLLRFAVSLYHDGKEAEAVIDDLVERKLLLHRRHSDELSVWHGADVDLRGRLEDEKFHQREQLKLLDFLAQEAEPPTWRPGEYNDDFRVRRYLSGEYHDCDTLMAYLRFESPLQTVPTDCDGRVLYILAETAEQLQQAEEIAHHQLSDMDTSMAERVVLALPREPLPLREAALEVACLLRMQFDADLVGSDPLVMPELQQMTDDARSHLQHLMDRLVRPGPHGPRWFHGGREFAANSPRDLRKALSGIMRQVYGLTPKINNEMIVRHKPSPQIVNARKKLLLGILERSGTENLGIDGNFPDASMLRTVLMHTGLYRHDANGQWRYALPDDVEDPGLRAVWTELQQFLTEPATAPKELRPLFDRLMEPPYGVRAGLIPLLFAAALKAFPSALSLTKAGAYVTDILPSDIEQLCREPELYRLRVLQLNDAQRVYLHGLHAVLTPEPIKTGQENDLIRLCFDALERWKAQLPPAALVTKRLSASTQSFQAVLRRPADPVYLLLDQLPTACGYAVEQHSELLQVITTCAEELMSVAAVYHEHAAASVRRTLSFGHDETDRDVREVARQWADCFAESFIEQVTDGVTKGLLSRMRTPYDSDAMLIESLSSLLVGKPLSRWDDSTIAVFDRELQSVVRRVEETVLAGDATLLDQGTAAHGLAELVRGRMTTLFERLITLVGSEAAQETLLAVQASTRSIPTGKDCHGDH
jgi:hypothetical protein